ncbi:NmrA/HSCARG family protein [Phytomonospora sp. NPDC050363]|uniref:NmrA/HSCARG family protein n=1 Tax=Phytomonospora sp. NPDC050363 TaxID=3155642 RepID=UPI0033ECECF4
MRTILVTGATGQQGGAAARHLLKDGWHVRALVRDPAKAAGLAAAGAELVVGDMADRASLDAVAAGAHGVFSVQPANFGGVVVDEVALGVNVADAAAAAGVEHLVYTSVGAADRADGHSAWATKAAIEKHIEGLGVPTTVLRPVMFMENHAHPVIGVRGEYAVLRLVPPTSRVQLIAVEDIGAFTALAFADPDRHAGKGYELAGDELPREELVAAISAVTGPIDISPHSVETMRAMGIGDGVLRGEQSYGDWHADIPALREIHPGLLTFADWLKTDAGAKLRRE